MIILSLVSLWAAEPPPPPGSVPPACEEETTALQARVTELEAEIERLKRVAVTETAAPSVAPEPPPRTTTRYPNLTVTSSADALTVLARVHHQESAFRLCALREPLRTVRLTATIGGNGRVREVTGLLYDPGASHAAAACVVDAFQTIAFPTSPDGTTTDLEYVYRP